MLLAQGLERSAWPARVAQEYSWALWLAAPALFVILAALWSWWRGRSRKPASMQATMGEHDRYLAVLSRVTAARPQPHFPAPEASTNELPADAAAAHDIAS